MQGILGWCTDLKGGERSVTREGELHGIPVVHGLKGRGKGCSLTRKGKLQGILGVMDLKGLEEGLINRGGLQVRES